MELGILSQKYESSGDPGAINHHDGPNGASSYGVYQFYSGAGVVQAFIAEMTKSTDPKIKDLGVQLAACEAPPSDAFNALWIKLSKDSKDVFIEAQRAYAKEHYYDPAAADLLKAGLDVSKRSMTLQNVVWSCAIQYGASRVPLLFDDAAKFINQPDANACQDKQLFMAVYYMRATSKWNKGLPHLMFRFMMECHDALELYASETEPAK